MHQLFENDSDDDVEDDWFFDSVTRYKQLLMFTLEGVVVHVEASSRGTVCVAQRHRPDRHEILDLVLPDKLVSPPSQDCLPGRNTTDFKVHCGALVQTPLVQMKCLYGRGRVVTSERDAAGIQVYQLGSKASDLMTRVGNIATVSGGACLAADGEGRLLASAVAKDGVQLLDVCAGTSLLCVPLGSSEERAHPAFAAPHLAAVCYTRTGLLKVTDLRQQAASWISVGSDQSGVTEEQWTVASLYESCVQAEDSPQVWCEDQARLALLSTNGRLLVYDMRNTRSAILDAGLGPPAPHMSGTRRRGVAVKFSPGGALLSAAGFDANVRVYDCLSSDCTVPAFTHEGHVKHKVHKNCTALYVSSHMWLRTDIVISAGSDGSLHCWQF